MDSLNLALQYHHQSLEIQQEIGDQRGMANSLIYIAGIYTKQQQYEQSADYAQRGMLVAQRIKALLEVKNASKVLYQNAKQQKNYVKALEYHELYKQTDDAIFNIDKAKSITNLETQTEIARKEQEIALLNKNKALLEKDNELQKIENERQRNAKLALEKQAEADRLAALARQEKDQRKQDSLRTLAQEKQLEADGLKAKEQQLKAESKARQLEILKTKKEQQLQQTLLYLSLGSLLVMMVFVYFIYRSRQKISQQHRRIRQQAKELQQVNEELVQQQDEITTANESLELTNQRLYQTASMLKSSIHSAKKIQTAILPRVEKMDKLLQHYFVLYRPKDVVSGDFYWIDEVEGRVILIVADCTGHGVEGAFMILIASTLLEKIINVWQITQPSEILTRLHQGIEKILQ